MKGTTSTTQQQRLRSQTSTRVRNQTKRRTGMDRSQTNYISFVLIHRGGTETTAKPNYLHLVANIMPKTNPMNSRAYMETDGSASTSFKSPRDKTTTYLQHREALPPPRTTKTKRFSGTCSSQGDGLNRRASSSSSSDTTMWNNYYGDSSTDYDERTNILNLQTIVRVDERVIK